MVLRRALVCLLLLAGVLVFAKPECRIGDSCDQCDLLKPSSKCSKEFTKASLYCDVKSNRLVKSTFTKMDS
ncbi:hypothetical protein L596_024877 [Steinernema carpocapsae]|uniref:Uncharacterized protein n=1 Tax=Steinernema carpocapsae TaxID=34508 RepID=A0A4U5M634_STECR|nr:hypothetical protein L596_024877 [Steinernema carpocapsae]